MDGYDKLKPYGIAISGCIDSFSHYVVWMEAYTTIENRHNVTIKVDVISTLIVIYNFILKISSLMLTYTNTPLY